jgi:hypothetical protein
MKVETCECTKRTHLGFIQKAKRIAKETHKSGQLMTFKNRNEQK